MKAPQKPEEVWQADSPDDAEVVASKMGGGLLEQRPLMGVGEPHVGPIGTRLRHRKTEVLDRVVTVVKHMLIACVKNLIQINPRRARQQSRKYKDNNSKCASI